MPRTTPAGSDDSAPGFSFPAIGRKKITAAFDGGRLTSDGGVLLLAQAERAMGLCRRLAACIADPRDPARVIHRLDDILRARVFAIACGYEDPMISTLCVTIRASAWRWASCRDRARGWPANQR
jgi:hypothetical protein